MTEEEAVALVEAQHGSEVRDRIALFLAMVAAENSHQNLVAVSTVPHLWARHALDSLQLLDHAADRGGLWIDVGSGGGFPGLPVAIAREDRMLLVEPRRKRGTFLTDAVAALGLADRVTVAQTRIEKVEESAAIISARAVAGIEPLFEMAHHCAGPETRWLLPRGRIGPEEIDQVRHRWKVMFHVEQSRVSADSSIAIFDGVRRR